MSYLDEYRKILEKDSLDRIEKLIHEAGMRFHEFLPHSKAMKVMGITGDLLVEVAKEFKKLERLRHGTE